MLLDGYVGPSTLVRDEKASFPPGIGQFSGEYAKERRVQSISRLVFGAARRSHGKARYVVAPAEQKKLVAPRLEKAHSLDMPAAVRKNCDFGATSQDTTDAGRARMLGSSPPPLSAEDE